jgi:hypothetical protein
MAFAMCSCGKKEYCNACSIEINILNNEIECEYIHLYNVDSLITEYESKGELTYYSLKYFREEQEKSRQKIEEKEDKRLYFELECKKYNFDYMSILPVRESYLKVKNAREKYYN